MITLPEVHDGADAGHYNLQEPLNRDLIIIVLTYISFADDVACDASPGQPTAELSDELDNEGDSVVDAGCDTFGDACSVGVCECVGAGNVECNTAGAGRACTASAGQSAAVF